MSKVTTEYEIPWEWALECLKEDIRKDTIVRKRRKKIQKACSRY